MFDVESVSQRCGGLVAEILIFAQGVGIHGMEVYFPRLAVSQSELEKYMGAGEGKFTIG